MSASFVTYFNDGPYIKAPKSTKCRMALEVSITTQLRRSLENYDFSFISVVFVLTRASGDGFEIALTSPPEPIGLTNERRGKESH